MKIRNSYVKLSLLIVSGLVLGFVLGVFSNKVNVFRIRGNVFFIGLTIVENIIWLQLILLSISLLALGRNLLKIKKLYSNYDEENDETNESIEKIREKALTFTQIAFILSLIFFSVAMDGKNSYVSLSIISFVMTISIIAVTEIYLINQVKKYDEGKKGDPANLTFERQWINSCDEAEKIAVYKVSYETLKVMKYTFLISIIVLFILKMKTNTGNFPIILVGSFWVIMIMSSFFNTRKIKSRKLVL